MGGFSTFMTLILGIKFRVRPVMAQRNAIEAKSPARRVVYAIVCGSIVGFICGFIGAGGGMMMLVILTSVLGYELKCAVGTSVFIMSFTALTGAASHFVIGGMPDIPSLIVCALSTLVFARLASILANKASPKVLNRTVGAVLAALGICMIIVNIVK